MATPAQQRQAPPANAGATSVPRAFARVPCGPPTCVGVPAGPAAAQLRLGAPRAFARVPSGPPTCVGVPAGPAAAQLRLGAPPTALELLRPGSVKSEKIYLLNFKFTS
jgi:hypothetical protein